MPTGQASTKDRISLLEWAGFLYSMLALVMFFLLQNQQENNYSLQSSWTMTVIIAIAAVIACLTKPPLSLRIVFVVLFVAQMPAFVWALGEISERDTILSLTLIGEEDSNQQKIDDLEIANAILKHDARKSYLFWKAISHLTGMGFALLACIGEGQGFRKTG